MSDKPFKVKNGLEVNGSLLVANITSGRVGINTLTPDADLSVDGTMNASLAVAFGNTLSVTGAVTTAADFTVNSDYRYKKEIAYIEDAVTKVKALRGVTFTRIADDTRGAGVIAQDVIAVLPEAVSVNEDGKLSVAYGQLVGLLIEAIKELDKRVDWLEDAVEELHNRDD